MDQVAQVFLLLEKRNRADSLTGGGAAGKERGTGEREDRAPPGPPAEAHLATTLRPGLQLVEVFPEQQRVFILFPCQTVTIVVEVEGLSRLGGTGRGMSEQSGCGGPGEGEHGARGGAWPGGCPKPRAVARGHARFSKERSSSNTECVCITDIPNNASLFH